jgi:TMEM175 potassium channel family protein
VSKTRLEAFSDGVFAIAITLLVLVFLEHGYDAENLGHDLLHEWTSYIAYVVTFVTIGIIWVNHHTLLAHFATVDRTFLYLNVFFLVPVAFLPFPTDLVARFIRTDGGEAAALVYGGTMVVMALMFNALWHYGSHERRLLRDDVDERDVSGISRSYAGGPFLYGVATLVALISPELSAVLYAVIAAVYVSTSIWGRTPA